jgi:hypothetical protein
MENENTEKFVYAGAVCECSFGSTPSGLITLPTPTDKAMLKKGVVYATVKDNMPLVNILPFGMCKSMANPTVAAATAAALGEFTPMPCVPNTQSLWSPGSADVMLGDAPALTGDSRLMCSWGGIITITHPGMPHKKQSQNEAVKEYGNS